MAKLGGRAQLDEVDHMRTSVSYRVGPVFQLFEISGRIIKLSCLRWVLKKIFCLAGDAKLAMVDKNS